MDFCSLSLSLRREGTDIDSKHPSLLFGVCSKRALVVDLGLYLEAYTMSTSYTNGMDQGGATY